MDSLANYCSDGENSNNSGDAQVSWFYLVVYSSTVNKNNIFYEVLIFY